MDCPKCGWAREPEAIECPACGIVYERYRGDDVPPPADPDNPYAPPRSDLQGPAEDPAVAGVWRRGDLLVMEPGAVLPERCIVCNGPADLYHPKNLYWHHPAINYLMLLNKVLFLVVSLLAKKKVQVDLPLCHCHERRRKRWATVAAILIMIGIVVWSASGTQIQNNERGLFELLIMVGGFFVCTGLIVLGTGGTPAYAAHIDEDYIWLKKVHDSYLDRLPPAPPRVM